MEFGERLTLSRSGDPAAREELFGRWRPLLLLQAYSLLGDELAAALDPSDVVQEALTQATQDLALFRGQTEGEWLAWLRTQVAGHAAKARRHHRASKRDVGRAEPLREPLAISTPDGPTFHAMDREEALRLAQALERLPGRMRTVVVERVLHDRPFPEIAAVLGCSAGAARVLWTRALRKLRDSLTPP